MDLREKDEIMIMLSAAACESKHKILADTVYNKDRKISHYAVDYVHGETVRHIVERMQELLTDKPPVDTELLRLRRQACDTLSGQENSIPLFSRTKEEKR